VSPKVTFRCPGCDARIKAPAQLWGERRRCPGCGTPFVVRSRPPEDSDPVLATPGGLPAAGYGRGGGPAGSSDPASGIGRVAG
jgi:hypothetical protein